jgi:hypothetical protein
MSDSIESIQAAAAAPDQLTVLVFKDNFTARTFRIPIRWITQFGWLLAAMFLTALLCIGIAVKVVVSRPKLLNSTYVTSTPESQVKIHDLETQLKEAQDKIQALSATNTGAIPATPVAAASQAPETSDAPVINPALLSPASPISSRPFLFKALPDEIQAPPAEVPIILGNPSARWNGKTLAVRFNLQYVSKTPGGQQGRIIILTRGPGMILTHPSQVLQPVGKDILIDPNKGEYFSVSRFRDTKADFGPVSSHDSIQEVEVIVLGSNGQMLIHHKIIPGSTGSAQPKAQHKAESSSTSSSASDDEKEATEQ